VQIQNDFTGSLSCGFGRTLMAVGILNSND